MQQNSQRVAEQARVCVIGLWHLGSVTAAGLADLGWTVVGADENAASIAGLAAGKAPLFEPGLDEMLHQHVRQGTLTFTTDLAAAVKGSGFVLITYDTPVDERDQVDLTQVLRAAEIAGDNLDAGATVIVSSQVPVGTCQRLKELISGARPGRPFSLAYVPENLRLGRAIERFRRPAMVVIGADEPEARQRVREFYSRVPAPAVEMNLASAEMTKHAINSYLATCISYINELANLCDEAGADATKVVEALRHDERVSPHAPLAPGGLGFAGGTLARDVRALQALGSRLHYPTHLMDAVLAVNQEQRRIVLRRLRAIYGGVEGLTVGILGLTYKPDTSTLRRSAALEIIDGLVAERARVKAFDPRADLSELADRSFEFCSDPLSVAPGCDALVIVTEWPEFRDLPYSELAARMNRAVLIDTKNLLDPAQMRQAGFAYYDVGRGTMQEACDRAPVQTTT